MAKALLALSVATALVVLVAFQSLPAQRPAVLESELADGAVATVHQTKENIIGSLGSLPSNKRATDGNLLTSADLIADGETPASEPSSEQQESAADAKEYDDAGLDEEGVVPEEAADGLTDFNKAASAENDLDHYFDNLPVHDVTPEHSPKGIQESRLSNSKVAPEEARFHNEPNAGVEWDDKLRNLDEAVHLFQSKGDAALEQAVQEGLTKRPYGDLGLSPVDLQAERQLATPTGNKIGGVDGLRAVQYKKLLDSIQGGVVKERKIMAKLGKDLAMKKAQQAEQTQPANSAIEAAKAAIDKYDDKTLDFNPPGQSRDEFSNFNPPKYGEPAKTPFHGVKDEASQQTAKDEQQPAVAADKAPSQLGFIGGSGIEGGQGNSDSIYGSHDDHSTYGVAGSGWQGPGNGEAPGDLWSPAMGDREKGILHPGATKTHTIAKLGFIGGAGIEGGQGNSDSIYGSHDDHSTYGVLGSGWQGPGNGEAPGDLWNPAKGPKPHKSTPDASISILSKGLAEEVDGISHNMVAERHELLEAQDTLKKTEAAIQGALRSSDVGQEKDREEWESKQGQLSEARSIFGDLRKQEGEAANSEDPAVAEAALAEARRKLTDPSFAKKIDTTTALTRINKIDEPTTDLNPSWSPGWIYDEYSNYNPPVSGEPAMVHAGEYNSKYGFKTWQGDTGSEAPPVEAGRYGDGGAMDATRMPVYTNGEVFKGTNTAMLAGKQEATHTHAALPASKAAEAAAHVLHGSNSLFKALTANKQQQQLSHMSQVDAAAKDLKADLKKDLNEAVNPLVSGSAGAFAGGTMDGTTMSAIFKDPKQTALAIKNDELAMNIDQQQLRLAQGTLASMAMHSLEHHNEELARARSPQGPEPLSQREAWDKKDVARTEKVRSLLALLVQKYKY